MKAENDNNEVCSWLMKEDVGESERRGLVTRLPHDRQSYRAENTLYTSITYNFVDPRDPIPPSPGQLLHRSLVRAGSIRRRILRKAQNPCCATALR